LLDSGSTFEARIQIIVRVSNLTDKLKHIEHLRSRAQFLIPLRRNR